MKIGTNQLLSSLWNLFLIVVGAAIAVILILFFLRTDPVLDQYRPATVVNLATIQSDGYILVEVEKCSKSQQSIGLVSMVSVQHSNNKEIIIPVGVTGQQLRTGCALTTTRYPFSAASITGGQWKVIGIDIVVGDRAVSQSVLWSTPPFTVD